MRELKFRAWDKNLNHYFYNVAVYPNNIAAIQRHNIESMMLKAEYGATHWTELDEDAVIEQYTGLKDQNNKEIYEGDIVKMPDWQTKPIYEVVEYHKAGFDPFQEGCFGCASPDGEEVEVVGNIHENPELILTRSI